MQRNGTQWLWCPRCKARKPFTPLEYGDYECDCGYVEYSTPPLPYLYDEKELGPHYKDDHIKCSGYIPFSEAAQRLGKSKRTLRYDIATSNYPILTTGIKQDGRCLYQEDLVDLTARTDILIRHIDGALIIKASDSSRIMGVTPKTVINDIKSQKVSGWCSGGHYWVDMQNALAQADARKPSGSAQLRLDTRRLFQAIRDQVASGRPLNSLPFQVVE